MKAKLTYNQKYDIISTWKGDFMNTYYIYEAKNLLNGKLYIGCTNNIGQRIRQHILTAANCDTEFHKALNKYGITNFAWRVLETCIAKEDAVVLEAKYISDFNTIIPNGYNMAWSNGGNPKTRPIVCLSLDGKFKKRYEYFSDAVKDGYDIGSIRASLKSNTRTSFNHIFMYEDDYIKNGAKKYRKPVSKCAKKIVMCDLEGNFIAEYESVTSASDQTGFNRSNISANLTGMSKTTNNHIFVYKNNYPIKDLSVYKKCGKGIKVVQLDKETGELLNVFEKISDAGKYIGKSYKNIQKVLENQNKTAYGYKWMRYEEYMKSIS